MVLLKCLLIIYCCDSSELFLSVKTNCIHKLSFTVCNKAAYSFEKSNFGSFFHLSLSCTSNQAFKSKSKISSVPVLFLAKNQADRQAEVREIKRRLTRKVNKHVNNEHSGVILCFCRILRGNKNHCFAVAESKTHSRRTAGEEDPTFP